MRIRGTAEVPQQLTYFGARAGVVTRFAVVASGVLAAMALAVGTPGCSGPGDATTSAKPKVKTKKPAPRKQASGQVPAAPNVPAAPAPHPTDALNWDDDKGERTPPAPVDAARDGDNAEAPPDSTRIGSPDEGTTATDGPGSGMGEPEDNGAAAEDGAAKPRSAAIDFGELEKNLVAAKAALTDEADEKDREQVFTDALSLVDEAIAADDFAVATRAVAMAMEMSPTLADTELAGEAAKAKRKVTQYEAAFRRATAAREKLAANAGEAAANSGVGSYLCYLQGKWEEGLPHLAKGEDAAAQKAATLDLANPTAAETQQAVADAWWLVAGRQDGIAKAQIMLRARQWYDQMRRSLAADEQEKLRARIEMIDKYAVATGVNVALGLDAELPEATGKLSPTQRGRVQQLLADFRHAAGNPARLEATANKLLNIGGPAVSQLLVEVNKQLQPQLQRYGQEFQKQALAVQASRGGANMAEVERLRAQVLALKEMPNLTKDAIVQQGDPAMAKLTEMLVVQPQMVLERSAKLRDERAKLLAVGRQWERAQQYLIAAMQEQESKAKSKRGGRASGRSGGANQADGAKEAGDANAANAEAEAAPPPPPNFAKYLEGEEELAAKMVMPMDERARETLAANGKLIGQIETEEARAILACNLMRQLLGLNVLKIDLKLSAAARDHSKDMATLGFFAHESPVPGKTTPWDRAKNFDTTASAENIAMGYADGNAANLGWFHSPGHHKNMLGSHERIGLGVHNAHYTEMFGR